MEVGPEWAKCCCCKLSISKSSGRLKWCADSERWKRSKCLKLMISIMVVFLPVAVVSLSIIKFTNTPQKPDNNAPPEVIRSVAFDASEFSESSRPNIIQDFHATSCFPTAKGFYTVRTKRNLIVEPYKGNRTTDAIIWGLPSEAADVYYLPSRESKSENQLTIIDKEKNLNNSTTQSASFNQRLGRYLKLNTYILPIHEEESKDKIEKNNQETNSPIERVEQIVKSKDNENILLLSKEKDQDGFNENIYSGVGAPPIITDNVPIHTTEQDDLSQQEGGDLTITQQNVQNKKDKMAIREAQAGLMKRYMDATSDPCQDFYQYACGNWGKLNQIPKDKTNYDTFEMLREKLDIILKELLEEKINYEDNDATIKAKNLYKSCVTYEILEERGNKPLLDLLNQLGGWPIITPNWTSTNFDWVELMANLRLYNNDILISEWVGPDLKNSDEYIIQFDQTSLGLPTRDHYLQSANHKYLQAYQRYLIKIAKLLGAEPERAKIQANEIVKFEIDLAKITSPPEERRNISRLYGRITVGQLQNYDIPEINWKQYLTIVLNRTCDESEPVVLFAYNYVKDLVALLIKTPSRTISNYLLWRFVRHRINSLDDRYQEPKQQFYHVLVGREKAPSRWKYCVTQVNSNLGMAVGAMFVRKYFDENSKNDTIFLTKEMQLSFNEILRKTNWISEETKTLASEKVNMMMLKVGYPDFILDSSQLNDRYKHVNINPEKYFENTLNILQYLTRVEQSYLGKLVNKTTWSTAPAVVNAYYSRNKNQMMFPAGIMQPPFYHRYFPRSLNYGGIGVVIGHEITHGFDDKGRLFDKYGSLQRWWKDEEINNFHQRASCLIDQYSNYVIKEVGIPLDGINTQGENIADNGGIKQAFRAYQRWLHRHGSKDEVLPGLNLTGHQLFFLNFAQVWCGNTRPEASKHGVKTALHSPGKFRVIGTLSNSEDFATTFRCPLGTPMNPIKKCSVW